MRRVYSGTLFLCLLLAGCASQGTEELPIFDIQHHATVSGSDGSRLLELPRDAVPLAGGDWAVLDASSAEILVLSSEMELKAVGGGRGSGPGELGVFSRSGLVPGGLMAARPGGGFGVLDPQNARLNLYDNLGAFEESFAGLMRGVGVWTFVSRDTVAASGTARIGPGKFSSTISIMRIGGTGVSQFVVEPTRFHDEGGAETWMLCADSIHGGLIAQCVEWPILRRYSSSGGLLEELELEFPRNKRFQPANDLVYKPDEYKKKHGLTQPGRPAAELFLDIQATQYGTLLVTSGVVCLVSGKTLVSVGALPGESTLETFAYSGSQWMLIASNIEGLSTAQRDLGVQ